MPFSKLDTIYLNESKRYRDALDLSKTLYFRNGQITLTGVCLSKKLLLERGGLKNEIRTPPGGKYGHAQPS